MLHKSVLKSVCGTPTYQLYTFLPNPNLFDGFSILYSLLYFFSSPQPILQFSKTKAKLVISCLGGLVDNLVDLPRPFL